MENTYKKQVALLIDILNVVSKVDSLALHGGTAINLFHLNMPRLSVDIDLTYIPFSDSRDIDLNNIRKSLSVVKHGLKAIYPNIRFEDEKRAEDELKLVCTRNNATVKIEVNQINRGLIAPVCNKLLCDKAQEEFDSFCEINTVSSGQLWGGKINAALERQHPRDIFDIKNMFIKMDMTDELKEGFIFFLLCGKRPISETLNPNLIDQKSVFASQFVGMTSEVFTYESFENIRKDLITVIYSTFASSITC
jgi:predicted nucleotidyltransferase component of viral defense system